MTPLDQVPWTKGPWHVGEMCNGLIDVKHSLGKTPGAISFTLAKVAARHTWVAEGEANARLIAESPTMAALLEEFVQRFKQTDPAPDAGHRLLISKCEGVLSRLGRGK